MSNLSRATVLKHYLKFRYRHFFSDIDLKLYQTQKLGFLFTHTLKRSPYYQDILSNLDSHDSPQKTLEHMPILTKKDYLTHFDTINTCGIKYENALKAAYRAEQNRTFDATEKGISIGLSSGTSGVRGLFLVDKTEKTIWTSLALARVLKNSIFEEHRIALILRANSDLYESTKSRSIQFKYFDLADNFFDIYSRIKQFNPTVLLGPASFLEKIAYEEEKLNFHDRLHPKQIISCAEILYNDVKRFLETVWHMNIDQIYQATEGFLAFTCTHGNLHFNEDCLYIEKEYIQNKNNKRYFFPIITDFFRTSQPIVRYKLNDILEEADSDCLCGCPFTVIKNILGREEDMIDLGEGKIFPDELNSLMENLNIKICKAHSDFQIIADNKSHTLNINLQQEDCVKKNEFEDLLKIAVKKFFENKKMRPPMIQIGALDERKPWIKRRRITNTTTFGVANNTLNRV